MIISARRVKTLREVRWCASCRTLLLTDCVSVYGSAGKPDKPYRIWLHESCTSADVKAALNGRSTRNPDNSLKESSTP